MSKHETPMIRSYWRKTRGTLIEEFPAVKASPTCGPRRLDAVILRKGEFRIAHWNEVSIKGKDIIVVQAKANRLGMYLMGQAVFSAALVKRFKPRSVLSIALCKKDDSELKPLLKRYRHIEVVVLNRQGTRKKS